VKRRRELFIRGGELFVAVRGANGKTRLGKLSSFAYLVAIGGKQVTMLIALTLCLFKFPADCTDSGSGPDLLLRRCQMPTARQACGSSTHVKHPSPSHFGLAPYSDRGIAVGHDERPRPRGDDYTEKDSFFGL
jgi:hypothetical protein